jgi:hypothetical protein
LHIFGGSYLGILLENVKIQLKLKTVIIERNEMITIQEIILISFLGLSLGWLIGYIRSEEEE